MDGQPATLHRQTPQLHILEPRKLQCGTIDFCRHDPGMEPQVRVQRMAFDVAGRPVSQWDPRSWADKGLPDLQAVYALSGRVLGIDSADAGWRLELPGEGRQTLESWDGRGTRRRMEYDALLRSVVVFENQRCLERLTYGGPESAEHNRCGQVTRHDDPAGTSLGVEFSLTGNVSQHVRHFLQHLEAPDWPEPVAERDALLEPGEGATTRWTCDPLGAAIHQTDALGNLQTWAYTVSGLPKEQWLQLDGQPSRILVGDIRYDVQGRVESETAGNGVVSTARYAAEDGRLLELKALRSSGEVLQDLAYDYDPVGNVTRIEDRAQPIRYFANQRIEPVSTYRYDTLYQLVEATGRELASVNHGPVFADFQSPPDPAQLANYTQTYRYDSGGNLQQLIHVGSQSHSRTLVTARHSNRSLPVINDHPPSEQDIAAAFDDNGNLLALQAGQVLRWNLRNQLQEVKPVARESGIDDSECYVYGAGGRRLRKLRTTQAKAVVHASEVRYLPGLEIRTDTATDETLQVITAQAGRNGVRVLHWQSGKPPEVGNDQVRYSLTDHLGSGSLELDGQAQIISQESYYPFGGTSWWAGRNAAQASYKTVRYSGKERDATGLYYYGFRYYAPWLQRWINPDPAGAVDGLNLFRFVRNSPLRCVDSEGAAPYDVLSEAETLNRQNIGYQTIARGLEEFTASHRKAFKEGVSVAASLLKHVIKELRKESPGHGISAALKATFGDIDDESRLSVIARLIPAFVRQKDFLESLTGTAGHKIDVFTTNINVRGLTYPSAPYRPEKTIALASFLLEGHHPLDLAKTLIHEASHATEGTSDVYYHGLDILARGSTHEQAVAWTTQIRRKLREVSRNGLDTRHIALVNLEGFIDAAEQPISPDALKQRFLHEPAVRVEVLLDNADTFPLFVLSTRLPAKVMAKRDEKQARPAGFRRGKEVF